MRCGCVQFEVSEASTAEGALRRGVATAKIADFGMAARMQHGRSHMSNVRQGTPFFVAPEVVREHRLHRASDVYSFGVIMWELMAGKSVYIVRFDPPPPSSLGTPAAATDLHHPDTLWGALHRCGWRHQPGSAMYIESAMQPRTVSLRCAILRVSAGVRDTCRGAVGDEAKRTARAARAGTPGAGVTAPAAARSAGTRRPRTRPACRPCRTAGVAARSSGGTLTSRCSRGPRRSPTPSP